MILDATMRPIGTPPRPDVAELEVPQLVTAYKGVPTFGLDMQDNGIWSQEERTRFRAWLHDVDDDSLICLEQETFFDKSDPATPPHTYLHRTELAYYRAFIAEAIQIKPTCKFGVYDLPAGILGADLSIPQLYVGAASDSEIQRIIHRLMHYPDGDGDIIGLISGHYVGKQNVNKPLPMQFIEYMAETLAPMVTHLAMWSNGDAYWTAGSLEAARRGWEKGRAE